MIQVHTGIQHRDSRLLPALFLQQIPGFLCLNCIQMPEGPPVGIVQARGSGSCIRGALRQLIFIIRLCVSHIRILLILGYRLFHILFLRKFHQSGHFLLGSVQNGQLFSILLIHHFLGFLFIHILLKNYKNFVLRVITFQRSFLLLTRIRDACLHSRHNRNRCQTKGNRQRCNFLHLHLP